MESLDYREFTFYGKTPEDWVDAAQWFRDTMDDLEAPRELWPYLLREFGDLLALEEPDWNKVYNHLSEALEAFLKIHKIME